MSLECENKFPVNSCANDILVKSESFTPNAHSMEQEEVNLRVPKVVSSVDVTVPVRDTICIPEGFYTIKHVTRKVTLTQCYVLFDDPENCIGHLYGEGHVLKNIEYATPIKTSSDYNFDCDNDCDCEEEDECLAMRNEYRDLTARVNFDFVVPIKIKGAITPKKIINREEAVVKECHGQCDSTIVGESDCERIFRQSVVLQEPFTCNLEKYVLSEALLSKKNCKYHDDNKIFDTVTEKFTLTLTINILQIQNLLVSLP